MQRAHKEEMRGRDKNVLRFVIVVVGCAFVFVLCSLEGLFELGEMCNVDVRLNKIWLNKNK